MTRIILFLISFYKAIISPFFESVLGKGCRFSPTCSEYAYATISKFGIIKGGRLALKRFLKCHSFSSATIDAIPEKN